MDICIIGTGYVGLVTGTVFADLGNSVICVDKDERKIEQLRSGILPIYEPQLGEMVARNAVDQRLSFTTDLESGVRRSEILFICVDTPSRDNGETDLSRIEEAARGIARYLDRYKVIVNKSTVPVGTGDLVRDIIARNKRRDVDFDVVSCPEFLREGSAIQDALAPDRIVIGAPSRSVAMKLLELYSSLERPMLITDVNSAELIKHASNAFLAMKISFINAIADICELSGADVVEVAKGMGYDPRIGAEYLQAGIGYGGSCFPKDVHSLIHTAAKLGYDFKLLKEVVAINERRIAHLLGALEETLGGLSGKVIAVLGLSFKPNTDDLREARSIAFIQQLLAAHAQVQAYDPVAVEKARLLLPDVKYCGSAYEAATDAEALLILTEWREFKNLNLETIRSLLKRPIIIDGRNIYSADYVRRLGFTYIGIGRRLA